MNIGLQNAWAGTWETDSNKLALLHTAAAGIHISLAVFEVGFLEI